MTSDQENLEDVIRRFKRGFATVDREALVSAVTEDFEWHLHWFDSEDQQPTGRVLRGIDAVMVEIERRRDTWTEMSYRDVEERFLPDLIVQTFDVSGVDATGRRFNNSAVDLYPVRNGRIARKQTYWKQLGPF